MICLYCHADIKEEVNLITLFERSRPLCSSCKMSLSRWREGRRCKFCHRLMQADEAECADCLFLSAYYERPGEIMSMLDYHDTVKMLFHRYKFTKDAALAEVLAMFLECRFGEYDFSIPIPVSEVRLAERGYNQTEMVLDAAGVKYHDALFTEKVTRQSELGKMDRLSAKNPFRFKADFNADALEGMKVLVVDDIYTTGITVHQAAETLFSKKPVKIDMLTFSKA
ncbi:ComF family protein [Salinicoccus albus]|uniref:ComF family protein n=1 Tax=Salinicoccus albus TaxID=418756 RepID=UPI0005264926|nr:ComF family protein [Salinicoccus albus]